MYEVTVTYKNADSQFRFDEEIRAAMACGAARKTTAGTTWKPTCGKLRLFSRTKTTLS